MTLCISENKIHKDQRELHL